MFGAIGVSSKLANGNTTTAICGASLLIKACVSETDPTERSTNTMSADNFYTLRTHPKGGYCFVISFMSDECADSGHEEFVVPDDHERFETMTEAMVAWNEGQEWDDAKPGHYPKYYNEYGLYIHPEVTEDPEGL